MTAATLTFGVTDLALDKVAEAKANVNAPKTGVAAFIVNALGSYLTGYLDKKARRLAELAVWFHGAEVTLLEERVNAPVDLNDTLVKNLDEMESSLLEMRAVVLKLIADFPGGGSSSVVASLRSVAHAATDLHEAASHFKWALMENDADVDVNSGNFEVFEDAESLLASLKQ